MGTTQITLKQCFIATGVAALASYAIRYGGSAGFACVAILAIVLVELVRGLGPFVSETMGWAALAAALIAFTGWVDSREYEFVSIPLEIVASRGSWLDAVLRPAGEGVARVRSVLVFAFYGVIAGWTWLRWTAERSVAEDGASGAPHMSNQPPYEEIWLEAPDGQTLQALHDGDVGILLYGNADGSEYQSSLDPNYDGDDDERIELQLSNGQVDEYPMAWVVSIATIRRALKHFEQRHERPDFISWSEY